MTESKTIEIVRGTTNSVIISLQDDAGNPYALGDGEKLIFGVKTNLNNSDCCIKKVVTAADTDAETPGEYEVLLAPADTEELPFGRFCYDVGLQVGADYFPVIPCSPFIISHNVTRREA